MPQGIQKWAVQCRNTAPPLGEHQIEIPFPKHLNQATSPPLSERDTAESVIVCPQCEQAYLYKGKEAYPLLFQTDDESEYPYPVAVCIVLSCAVEGCKSHTEVHTAMYDGETIAQAIARVRRATFHATCSNEDPLSFPDDDDFGLVTGAAAAPF